MQFVIWTTVNNKKMYVRGDELQEHYADKFSNFSEALLWRDKLQNLNNQYEFNIEDVPPFVTVKYPTPIKLKVSEC